MPRPRRQRFTVALANGEQQVILAYDAQGASNYFTSRGRQVLGVRRGDYRRDDQPSGVQSRLLLAEAFQVARDFFGLTLPLDIDQDGRKGGRWGVAQLVPTGPGVRISGGRVLNVHCTTGWKHRVRVKSWCDPQKAGETLWHELAHCMQSERDVLPTWEATGDPVATIAKARAMYYDGSAYLHKPWEVEARSYEAFNAERPLAR